ncbi:MULTISPECIES: helix-turn-helix transcriptional regulator [Streptomyces]|uniref:Helix-turn-helix domain-containing protein n=1 Tax=Streptomyces lycii TaxID=2654337 RepID=A0ABQ7FT53_9ACTN|nr:MULTISPECIES: helix-turn-helix transcriptional regulator [Streptomyces]KAF4411097.1 helix-turn-helix domain-containing protein [Streptomyces lycii]PGH47334.1 transcriptional regulator [Streptomyces sp. Ru87]
MDPSELGNYLQTRRSRVTPADVGLPPGPRRRVPGLRRDEVARLAGASVDYYTELERGRGAQPSEQMLAALAGALRLSQDERDHLFHLAGRSVPPAYGPDASPHPALLALLERLDGTPAMIITDLHETLAQNALGSALIGRAADGPGLHRSHLYRWFTHPPTRELHPPEDHDHHSRFFVADLRAAVGKRRGDSYAAGMVRELRKRSAEFAALWDTGDVEVRRTDRKRIVHPALGVLELDCQRVFSEDGRQRLMWFTAVPDTPAQAQLDLLPSVPHRGRAGAREGSRG